MRNLYLLIPAVSCVLAAQAPDLASLTQSYKAGAPQVETLIQGMQAREAMAKAESLIPATKPAFNPANIGTLQQSFDANRVLINMHLLWQKAARYAGDWEKQQEILEKALGLAQENKKSLDAGIAPIQQMWDKASSDAKEYIAKNEPQVAPTEEKLKKLQAEIADVNAGKIKLTKEQKADLDARGKQAGQEEQELNAIKANLPVHKENIGKAQKVNEFIGALQKDGVTDLDRLTKALEDTKKQIADQQQEIQAFNAKQKKATSGNGAWVDAVMRDKDNLVKLGRPDTQAAFLNRMLVLSPGHKAATKALENLKAGRDPFFVEKAVKPASKPAVKGRK